MARANVGGDAGARPHRLRGQGAAAAQHAPPRGDQVGLLRSSPCRYHAPLALKLLYRTVDAIWYAAGDNATDFNFYTKRALLAGVYSSTVLYWLNDKSAGCADSWSFLDRRIDEVMQVPKLLGRVSAITEPLPQSVPGRAAHAAARLPPAGRPVV